MHHDSLLCSEGSRVCLWGGGSSSDVGDAFLFGLVS